MSGEPRGVVGDGSPTALDLHEPDAMGVHDVVASSSGTGHDAARLREELMRCGALAISDRIDGSIGKRRADCIREIAYRACWPEDAAEEHAKKEAARAR